MPNTILLTDEQAVGRGKDLKRLIDQDIRDRQGVISRRMYTRNLYYGRNKRKERYPGQPNIHLHVLTEKIEGIVPKMMNAFWNADPHVNVSRIAAEFSQETTDKVQRYINWTVDTDIPNFYQTTETWFRNNFIDGVAVVKAWYNFEERNTVIIKSAKALWLAGESDLSGQAVPQTRSKVPAEILGEVLKSRVVVNEAHNAGALVNTSEEQESLVGLSFRVDFRENRLDYKDVLVEFHPSKYADEINVYIYRPVTVKDNVEVELVEFEDLIVPFRTVDLQSAERIAHQYWLTLPEIKRKVANDGWQLDDQDIEKLKAKIRGGERQEETPENKRMKRQKDIQIGELQVNSANKSGDSVKEYVDDKILIWEIYCRDDLDENGLGEEMIYQLPYSLGKIAKAQYLEEVFPHGRRPFAELHNIPISDRFYSLSIGELLTPINVEVNAIINMVHEAQEIINNPFFFYVPTLLTVDPKPIEGLKPGQGIPIGDPAGVIFPRFAQEPLANLSAMDSLLLFADRLTLSPQSVGSSQVRNAPRTARGTLALLSEAGVKVDGFIMAAQKGGWRELIHQIHALYAEFGPDEKFFQIVGEDAWRGIKREDLRGRFNYKFSGNTVNTNREVMRTIAQVRLTTLIGLPLYQTDLQAQQRLIRNFLQHFDEGANIDELVPAMPGGGGGPHPPMNQKTELELMMQGQQVSVLPLDQHAEHMQIIQKFIGGRRFADASPEMVANIAAHFQEHAQLLVQQQTRTGGPGQGNNVPVGAGLGNLEGGVQ